MDTIRENHGGFITGEYGLYRIDEEILVNEPKTITIPINIDQKYFEIITHIEDINIRFDTYDVYGHCPDYYSWWFKDEPYKNIIKIGFLSEKELIKDYFNVKFYNPIGFKDNEVYFGCEINGSIKQLIKLQKFCKNYLKRKHIKNYLKLNFLNKFFKK